MGGTVLDVFFIKNSWTYTYIWHKKCFVTFRKLLLKTFLYVVRFRILPCYLFNFLMNTICKMIYEVNMNLVPKKSPFFFDQFDIPINTLH